MIRLGVIQLQCLGCGFTATAIVRSIVRLLVELGMNLSACYTFPIGFQHVDHFTNLLLLILRRILDCHEDRVMDWKTFLPFLFIPLYLLVNDFTNHCLDGGVSRLTSPLCCRGLTVPFVRGVISSPDSGHLLSVRRQLPLSLFLPGMDTMSSGCDDVSFFILRSRIPWFPVHPEHVFYWVGNYTQCLHQWFPNDSVISAEVPYVHVQWTLSFPEDFNVHISTI